MDRSQLLTEKRNPASQDIDTATSPEIVDIILSQDQTVCDAVEAERDSIASLIDVVSERFNNGGRLFYVGAGTSGRLGVIDAAECPPTFGSPPDQIQAIVAGGTDAVFRSIEGAEDDRAAGANAIDACGVNHNDCVVGIAASGTTPFVLGALEKASRSEAHTAFITCSDIKYDSDPAKQMIRLLVGPEVITGSTRMKAGTATKMVLNMITTGAMIRTGKVYGNLMVDVQAWCDKLVDRAERIVMTAGDVDRHVATKLLENADGSAKTAIVMALLDVDAPTAQKRLEETSGHVRPAVQKPPSSGTQISS